MIAALVLACALLQGADELEKRAPIAHVAGFESISQVTFAADPARPHRLVATHVFPGRTKWLLTLAAEPNKARSAFYRSGKSWRALDEGVVASRELGGDERSQLAHFFSLREALVLWPDGRAWTGDGSSRRATVEGGTLVAELGAESLPTRIAWHDGTDVELEALREIVWRTEPVQNGRRAPASFTLTARGAAVWRETVHSLDFSAAYLDSFFTPPDRRAAQTGQKSAQHGEWVELPTCAVRRLACECEPDEPWKSQVTKILAAREALAKDPALRGVVLEDAVEVELDASGRPTAAYARLADPAAELPAGFVRRPGASALSLRFAPERFAPELALARLVERVPAGARAGRAYVRIGASGPNDTAQLVLAVVPAD
ncbi:MAG: hypothetical protein L6Q99_17690 [Planctomycetes bacterium]|nr:hypothetical protein [Planctomycetota bacterium]